MKKLAIVLNIIFVIIGFNSIFLAYSSSLVFDYFHFEDSFYLWVVVGSAIAMPFTCFGSVIASVIMLYKYNNSKAALSILLLPCVVIAIFIGSIALSYCQESFSCYGLFAFN